MQEESDVETVNVNSKRYRALKAWLQQLKWSKLLEIILLSSVILTVWGVFTIPTITFFALPPVDTEVLY